MVDFEKIRKAQEKEREFLRTPIGAAFHKFKSAHHAMASDDYNERASHAAIERRDTAARNAEREFREELDKLLANQRPVEGSLELGEEKPN